MLDWLTWLTGVCWLLRDSGSLALFFLYPLEASHQVWFILGGRVKLRSWKGASLCKLLEFSVRKTGLCDPVCLFVFIGSGWIHVCLFSTLGCNLILGYSFCCLHGLHLWGWLLCSCDVLPPLVFEHSLMVWCYSMPSSCPFLAFPAEQSFLQGALAPFFISTHSTEVHFVKVT